MKIRISFKSPDAVDYAVQDAFEYVEEKDPDTDEPIKNGFTPDDVKEQLGKWIQYGENITIEFDLAAQTASVVKRK